MNDMANIEVEDLAEPLHFGPEAYISEDYAKAEADKLWSKVWQHAGRIEEIPNVGDFITYDVGNDSILIVRADAETIKAYYNVCSHRGRQLVDRAPGAHYAHGHASQFVLRLPWLALQPGRQMHLQA